MSNHAALKPVAEVSIRVREIHLHFELSDAGDSMRLAQCGADKHANTECKRTTDTYLFKRARVTVTLYWFMPFDPGVAGQVVDGLMSNLSAEFD